MRTTNCAARLTTVKQSPVLLFENCITLNELMDETRGLFSKGTFYNWISKEGMPHVKVRGRLLFRKDQVFDWLERSNK